MAVGVASFLRAGLQYEILRLLVSGDVIRARRFAWLPDLPPGYIGPLVALWMLASLTLAAGFRTRLSGSIVLCSQ
jgi:hypothetical protein